MAETSTSDLIAAASAGDKAAFAALVRSQAPRLYAIASRVTGDDALAEDVVQETFLKILRGPGSIRNPAAADAWLARVATRLAIDLLRSRGARRKREEEYAMAHGGTVDRPDEKEIGSERSASVSKALGAIPAEARAAILLHIVDGQTVREVGACLGIPPSTARDRIRDGIEKIRRFLKRKGLLALAALPPEEILRGLPDPVLPPALIARLQALDASAVISETGAVTTSPSDTTAALEAFGCTTPAAVKVLVSIGAALVLAAAAAIAWKVRDAGQPEGNAPPPAIAGSAPLSAERAKAADAGEASGEVPPPPAAPAPAPRPALTVRVVDEDGKPAAGARVKIVWTEPVTPGNENPRRPPGLPPAQSRRTTKEIQLGPSPTGEFACRERQGSEVLVIASCPGFRFRTEMVEVPEGGLEAPVVVALEKGKPFSGRVVDAWNGDAPVEGALIGIGDPAESEPLGPFDARIEPEEPQPPSALFHSVASGPDGRFTITGVRGDLWILREGYGQTVFAMGWESPWEEEHEHRIPLLPPTHIHLSVRTADGDPVPSFEYRFGEVEPPDSGWTHGCKAQGSEADIALAHRARIAGGQAVLRENITASAWVVLRKTAGFPAGVKSSGSKSWEIQYGTENRIEIVVRPREAAVAGPARDPAVRPATAPRAGGGQEERESPGPSGAEAAPGPVAGGIALIGKVVGDGKPVAGLYLSLHVDPILRPVGVAQTDEDGSFRMEGIPPGKHKLTLVRRDFSPYQRMIDVEPGMGPVVIDASRRSIDGIVRSADGPVPDAKIEVLTELSPEGWIGWAPFRGDGAGGFRISGLFATRYVLIFEKDGFRRRPILLDLADPAGIARHDILLAKAGDGDTMRLEVLDGETGEAVQTTGAVIYAVIDEAVIPIAQAQGKGGGGRYEIEGLPSGAYRARIFGAPAGYAVEIHEIEHNGGGDQVIPLRLRPGGSLAVRISAPDGRAPRGSSIEVLSPDGAPVPIDPGSAKKTDQVLRFQGAITLSGLPAGDCRVRVESPGRERFEKVVKIEAGRTADLDVEYP
jgi:RNA polymerase sigma-70 factor (ECF subfamily)